MQNMRVVVVFGTGASAQVCPCRSGCTFSSSTCVSKLIAIYTHTHTHTKKNLHFLHPVLQPIVDEVCSGMQHVQAQCIAHASENQLTKNKEPSQVEEEASSCYKHSIALKLQHLSAI
ncbi:UNVERIFIED_CONTAM: hypothetical protein K2H54_035172 [Gekko kuhli]